MEAFNDTLPIVCNGFKCFSYNLAKYQVCHLKFIHVYDKYLSVLFIIWLSIPFKIYNIKKIMPSLNMIPSNPHALVYSKMVLWKSLGLAGDRPWQCFRR